jgi:hypothetical protein
MAIPSESAAADDPRGLLSGFPPRRAVCVPDGVAGRGSSAISNFVSAEDEAVVTGWTGNHKFRIGGAVVATACLVVLAVILFLVIRAR